MHELFVIPVVVERNDGDSIVDLIAKTISSIVHQKNVFHVSIRDDSQIFDKYSFLSLYAVVSIQPGWDQLSIRVDKV